MPFHVNIENVKWPGDKAMLWQRLDRRKWGFKPTRLDNVLFLLLLVCSDHHQQQQQHHPHPQKGAAAGGSSNDSTSEASPGRPRSMVGLDVHVNAAAMEAPSMMASGENWRERSSSDGKILKKTAS